MNWPQGSSAITHCNRAKRQIVHVRDACRTEPKKAGAAADPPAAKPAPLSKLKAAISRMENGDGEGPSSRSARGSGQPHRPGYGQLHGRCMPWESPHVRCSFLCRPCACLCIAQGCAGSLQRPPETLSDASIFICFDWVSYGGLVVATSFCK